VLGNVFAVFDDTRRGQQKATEHFLRAGELGLGKGFFRIAEIHLKKHRNWDDARLFLKRAAEKYHVPSIVILADEASVGYFKVNTGLHHIIQEDHRRTPDHEEAFRLYREGARLGDAGCCVRLGAYYHQGMAGHK
jgi:TPR repeat protein